VSVDCGVFVARGDSSSTGDAVVLAEVLASGFSDAAAEPAVVEGEPRCGVLVIVTVPAGFAVVTFAAVSTPSCAAAELVVWPGDESEVDLLDDSLDDDLLVDDGESAEVDCPVVSAEAMPHPKPMAAPIPNAAAKPPIRPTCADAPMRRLNPDRDRVVEWYVPQGTLAASARW